VLKVQHGATDRVLEVLVLRGVLRDLVQHVAGALPGLVDLAQALPPALLALHDEQRLHVDAEIEVEPVESAQGGLVDLGPEEAAVVHRAHKARAEELQRAHDRRELRTAGSGFVQIRRSKSVTDL
jgi:hypothetical protein